MRSGTGLGFRLDLAILGVGLWRVCLCSSFRRNPGSPGFGWWPASRYEFRLNPAVPGWRLWLGCLGTGRRLDSAISGQAPLRVRSGKHSPRNLAGLAWACCWHWWAGPSPILAEGPAAAAPRHCLLRRAAGFGGVHGPSPFLAEGPSSVVPCHSRLGPCWLWWDGPSPIMAQCSMGAVPHFSRPGPAVAFGGVVPRQSRRGAMWVQFPTMLGWGLLVAWVAWSLTNPS